MTLSTTEAFFRTGVGLPKGGGLPQGRGGLPTSGHINAMKYKAEKQQSKAKRVMKDFSEDDKKKTVAVASSSSGSSGSSSSSSSAQVSPS